MSVIRLLTHNGVNLAPYLESLTLDQQWGGPLKWSATLVHETGARVTMPSPLVPPGDGRFYNLILPSKLTMDRYLDLWIYHAGEIVRFPRLLAGDPVSDGRVLEWGGSDLTPVLQRDAQSMPDILADGGGVERRARAAMAEIASPYGVQVDYEGADYEIRELRRGSGGTPYGWMRQIAERDQLAPLWRGDNTLQWRRPVFDPASDAAEWEFVDRYSIKTGEIQGASDGVCNAFTVARLEPQGRVLGELSRRTPDSVNDRAGNKITLSRPSRSIVIVGQAENGAFGQVSCYDADDQVTAFRASDGLGPFTALKGPIVRVEFNFKPSPAVTMGFRVVVYGGAKASDGAFSFDLEDLDNIAQIGERREIHAVETPICRLPADARAMGEAMLAGRVRGTWRLPMTTPFANPAIRVGDRVRIIDWLTGGRRVWFVAGTKWEYQRRASSRLSILGIRPWI